MIEVAKEETGKVGVVVPHGVLFRGSSEGKIREQVIKENLLDAVIGLPSNLFFGTGIPTAILIFKRNKADDSVVFIDASREYDDSNTQLRLRTEDIRRIATAYQERREMERYAYVADLGEIATNALKLNIPRYVNSFEEEEEIDIAVTQQQIDKLQDDLKL